MASQRVLDALNNQLQMEFFSEYFYISMEAYFADNNLDGFANFFNVQAREERDHAYKIFNYIGRAGGKVVLQGIEQPKINFESPLDVFESALEHERLISNSIHDLVDLAISEKDHTTSSFLRWFIDEQSEEEESMEKIVRKLRLLKNDPAGLLMIDQELAQRTYIPPTQNA
ncbi:MAG: ferritin [Paeniclostridium sordellii]|uniref:Ferritin n=1 Tax=Paeniclostridium hominis TaxID=2764329 RepID=A0ABR7K613_9FIRM|nr:MULTISPECIES: ferritin [Paeniclostridium]MBC6004541.1 ferritin [Paeniclostridium hominis]MBC8632003.1 ferritin [[Eubacterium] tenue]MDU2591444.1 ferritin [Paeniclostridium sordellii]